MHHANAAGVLIPASTKTPCPQPMHKSPAAPRQPLFSIDTNQQQTGFSSQPVSAKQEYHFSADQEVTTAGTISHKLYAAPEVNTPSTAFHRAHTLSRVTTMGTGSHAVYSVKEPHHQQQFLSSGQKAQDFASAADIQARLASTARRLEVQMLQQTGASHLATAAPSPTALETAPAAASPQSAPEVALQQAGTYARHVTEAHDHSGGLTQPTTSQPQKDCHTAQQSYKIALDRRDMAAADAHYGRLAQRPAAAADRQYTAAATVADCGDRVRLAAAAACMPTVHTEARPTVHDWSGPDSSQHNGVELSWPDPQYFDAQQQQLDPEALPGQQVPSALQGSVHFDAMSQTQRLADVHFSTLPQKQRLDDVHLKATPGTLMQRFADARELAHESAAHVLHDIDHLPVGIPLTPQTMHAQPRDSLEASIWKLSSSQARHLFHEHSESARHAQTAAGPDTHKCSQSRREEFPAYKLEDKLGMTLQILSARHLRRM